jgi:hypothetical protein
LSGGIDGKACIYDLVKFPFKIFLRNQKNFSKTSKKMLVVFPQEFLVLDVVQNFIENTRFSSFTAFIKIVFPGRSLLG